MMNWLRRHGTLVVGLDVAGTFVGIALTATMEATSAAAWIAARQMYGLTALGFLFTATLIGPVTAVFPRMPLRALLLAWRRAIGVSACVFAGAHAACYTGPVLWRAWRELYAPGALWVIGLALGLVVLGDLLALTWTSRDASVKALGGQRWKRLHRTVHIAVPVVFVHALLLGTDFGVTRPPDVQGEPDAGCLIGYSILMATWAAAAWMRAKGVRWPKAGGGKEPAGTGGQLPGDK